MRKTLVAVVLGLVELAAYIAADPRDLPAWVVSAALAINAFGVWYIRNDRPVTREDLARKVDYHRTPTPPRRDDVAGPPRRHVQGDHPDRPG